MRGMFDIGWIMFSLWTLGFFGIVREKKEVANIGFGIELNL